MHDQVASLLSKLSVCVCVWGEEQDRGRPTSGREHRGRQHEIRNLPGGGTYVTNLRSMDVTSTVDVMRIMRIGAMACLLPLMWTPSYSS